MKALLVPDQVTKLAFDDVARAFRSAYETVCGVSPSKACLALLLAQSALETGRWKLIHCYNFGNVKASETYQGYYCLFRCNEVIGGKVQWFDPPHPQCRFRAFLNVETGALDHIRFLANRQRYAYAWEVAKNGTPLAFVDALKRAGYFTADEAPYAKAVASLWREYMALLEKDDTRDTVPVLVTDDDCAAGMSCVAPDPERWVDEELRVLAIRAMELADEGLQEARRAERDRNMQEE